MPTYIYQDFTAQGINVKALMSLYAELEKNNSDRPTLTPIVVFMAFSIESYLNSLGSRALDIWDDLERLPWKKKIEILHKTVGKKADWGAASLQFATEVFKLRDKLAHGKPERILSEPDQGNVHYSALTPDWYKHITKEWVIEAKDRFTKLMVYLGKLFELHESDHLMLSTGGALVED